MLSKAIGAYADNHIIEINNLSPADTADFRRLFFIYVDLRYLRENFFRDFI